MTGGQPIGDARVEDDSRTAADGYATVMIAAVLVPLAVLLVACFLESYETRVAPRTITHTTTGPALLAPVRSGAA